VAEFSVFIPPKAIGVLSDDDSHHVAYDDQGAFFCSEPKAVHSFSASDLVEKFKIRLKQEERPFKEILPEVLADAERVRIEVKNRSAATHIPGLDVLIEGGPRRLEPAPTPRQPKPVEDERAALRELADIASRDFNAQLIIIQMSA
jgi:hypothetical protein